MLSVRRTFFILFLAVGIETSMSTLFPAPDKFPHISLLVLLYVALQEGVGAGIRFGLWLGLLLDMLSPERFGTHTALYAATGALCGLLRGKVFAEAFISQWTVPAVAYLGILSALSYEFQSTEAMGDPTGFLHLLRSSPYFVTVLVAPLVFVFCEKRLHDKRITPHSGFLA